MTTAENINTSNAKPGDILISLTHPRGGRDEPTVSLEVKDRMSGETLVSVRLSAADFANIMSSMATRVSGAFVTPNPGRIGKVAQNTSRRVERGSHLNL